MATPRLAKLELPAGDGDRLHVTLRSGGRPGEGRPAVVICHGFKGFQDWGFFPPLAERLATAGFAAWTFNFSSSGVRSGDVFDEPERFARQRPSADLADIATVVTRAIDEGAPWVALIGHSRGGGLAILHAARDARIRALVTWAAVDDLLRWPADEIARWRREGRIDIVNQRTGLVLPIYTDALDDYDLHREALDIVQASSQIAIPWLIVHGTDDASVSVAAARRLAVASRSPRTEMLLLEGADHGFGARHPWAGGNPVLDQVFERTVGFLARAL